MSAPPTPAPPTVAKASADDLDEIMAIEEASFSAPWTRQAIADELDRPWSFFRVLRNGNGQLLAYLNFWVIHDELHILNVATHPDQRRHGYARLLLDQMVADADRNACAEIVLEVRRNNIAAQHLYESLGFQQVGLRKGYYTDSGEDALVYTRKAPDE